MNPPSPNAAPGANLAIGAVDGGAFLANLNHFSRLLRKIGLRAGADTTKNAAAALCAINLANREDSFWALAAVYVNDVKQLPIFRQAFDLFWRAEKPTIAAPSDGGGGEKTRRQPTLRRLAEALARPESDRHRPSPPPLARQKDARLTASDNAALRDKDFEQMSGEEWRAAMRCLRELSPRPLPSRRRRLSPSGQCDIQKTARAAFAKGGEIVALKRAKRRLKPPRIVVLADISASMAAYARPLAHFIAALNAADSLRLSAFLFGAQLTPLVLRKKRDLDFSIANIAAATRDWEGGTRIGDSLARLNREWRRALGGDATVLLATDGLERGAPNMLEKQARLLRGSCRRLLWLNPLSRYDDYQPIAKGAAALARHADNIVPIHNVNSIANLTRALTRENSI